MTENEKLRALLKRARDEMQDIAGYMDIPNHEWPNARLKMTARAYKRMVATIDAALAEPPTDTEARLKVLEDERNKMLEDLGTL
jgi:hypothetical protein